MTDEETVIWPTPDELAAYEALREEDKTYTTKPEPKILVPLDLEDLDLISSGLKETGVLGVKTTIDAYWVALKVRIGDA